MSQHGVESFKVLTTLAAYRVVSLDTAAASTVVYPPAGLSPHLGITKDTVKDTTGSIAVAIAGIAKLTFIDTVSCGALVAADTSGQGKKYTDVTAGAAYVGIALQTVSATGTIADVLIQPGFKAIP